MPRREKLTDEDKKKGSEKKKKEINVLTVSLNAVQTTGMFGINYLGSSGLPERIVDKNRKITK